MESERSNIILLVLDTVRASNMSIYGYDRDTTPFLREFTQDNYGFSHAFSPARYTTPSHASLFTGAYPEVHCTNINNQTLNQSLTTFSEILSDSGYETVGISNNVRVSETFNFDRGFDHWYDNMKARGEPLQNGFAVGNIRPMVESHNSKLRKILQAIKLVVESKKSLIPTIYNWMHLKMQERNLTSRYDSGARDTVSILENCIKNKLNNQPFFAFINLMEAHTPFYAPSKYHRRYRSGFQSNTWGDMSEFYSGEIPSQKSRQKELIDQYDGMINYIDAIVEKIMNILKQYDVYKDTWIIITSDHGEAFGENHLYGHAMGLYDQLTHVPLILKSPGATASDWITEPVSTQWILPTIISRLNFPVPDTSVSANLFDADRSPVVLGYDQFNTVPGSVPNEEFCVNTNKFSEVKMIIDDNIKMYDYPHPYKNEIINFESKEDGLEKGINKQLKSDLLLERNEELDKFSKLQRQNKDSHDIDQVSKNLLRELGYID
jgi:arylsulfatase A-like enzyme